MQSSPSKSRDSNYPPDVLVNNVDLMGAQMTPKSSGKDRISLVDNKTRRSGHMPSHNMTLTSRLQLMAYWQLFSELLSTATSTSDNPLDLQQLWRDFGLNDERPFSGLFREQLATLAFSNGLTAMATGLKTATCLRDMVNPFWCIIGKFASTWELAMTLRLVYRPQHPPRDSKKGKAQKFKSYDEQEAEDIEKAIRASLLDLDVQPASAKTDEALPSEASTSGLKSSGTVTEQHALADLSNNVKQLPARTSSSSLSSLTDKTNLQGLAGLSLYFLLAQPVFNLI